MFKRLGRFAVLAVCLFAIAIVMVGCGGDEVDPPITGGGSGGGGQVKTFKEQLVGGSWRIVASTDGESINVIAQSAADGFAIGLGFAAGDLKGTISQNSLRFDNAGKVTWIMGVKLSDPGDPAGDSFELIYTLKGAYWIGEDEGSSALMTLSFTEGSAQFKGLAEEVDGEEIPVDEFLGDVLENERAAINGDQLRMGSMIAER